MIPATALSWDRDNQVRLAGASPDPHISWLPAPLSCGRAPFPWLAGACPDPHSRKGVQTTLLYVMYIMYIHTARAARSAISEISLDNSYCLMWNYRGFS